MKKIICLSFMILFSSSFTYSQHLSENKVPAIVKDAFSTQFPNSTDIRWGKESSTEYEVEFKIDDVKMSANYSDNGNWVETETTIDPSALPQAVVDAINRDYSNAKIYGAAKIEKSDKTILYEADIRIGKKKRELNYDVNGNQQ
jgi:hypothetical protein